jgi:hypothetical protein
MQSFLSWCQFLTMKWSNRIAQGFSPGFSPGWATPQDRPESTPNPADAGCNSKLAQYSNTPILHHSAWPDSRTSTTTRTRTKRLTSGDRMCDVESRLDVMNGVGFGMVVFEETAPLGRHFQGGLRTCRPRAKALGYSVGPFHGQ